MFTKIEKLKDELHKAIDSEPDDWYGDEISADILYNKIAGLESQIEAEKKK